MELFTTGVDQYTEQDIGEASRALTGWIVQGKNAVFRDCIKPETTADHVPMFDDAAGARPT